MRNHLLTILTMLALLGPVWAEPANLQGGWTLVESGVQLTRHLFFLAGGPHWRANSNGKLMVTLDLEPTEEENQWTGVLKEWDEHRVRVTLTNPDRLELREVDGQRSWTMERKRP
jgi:hypothetical protein